MTKQELDNFLSYIIKQAEYLLKEFGEFYPFGYVINVDKEVKPVNLYLNEDMPSSLDVITALEKAYKNGVYEGKYRTVAICIDVRVIPPSMEEKMDALEIRINSVDNYCENWYVPYILLDNQIKFYNPYNTKGNLQVF